MNQNSLIQNAVRNWESQNSHLNKLLSKISNEQLLKEIAPNKNTGLYLLGHIIAVNQNMLVLFNVGEKFFPDLDAIFLLAPDKSVKHNYMPEQLKQMWLESVNQFNNKIEAFRDEDWLDRHTSVSEEDFLKEPHRNKINVLINRTLHQAYHTGQLALL